MRFLSVTLIGLMAVGTLTAIAADLPSPDATKAEVKVIEPKRGTNGDAVQGFERHSFEGLLDPFFDFDVRGRNQEFDDHSRELTVQREPWWRHPFERFPLRNLLHLFPFGDGFHHPAAAEDGKHILSWRPRVDISEKSGYTIVLVDLPGVKREQVNLTLSDNLLTIHGERDFSKEEVPGAKRVVVERAHGSFTRSFKLHKHISARDIRAGMQDGVLEVAFPTPKHEAPTPVPIAIRDRIDL